MPAVFKRKILAEIKKWYDTSSSALLLDGARQVGKTTAIRNFLQTQDVDYIEFNLLENKLAKEAFDSSSDTKTLMLRISSLAPKEIKDDTVIFIDEIQEAKDALTPIKFLVQKAPNRFVFSGSLLGVKMKGIASVPVGFLKTLTMHPMDFEEFLWANRVSEKTIAYLKDCFDNLSKVDDIVHKQMMSVFRTYLAVGGMPKAVNAFVEKNDLRPVNMALEDIDSGYREDIVKYQSKDKLLIQEIYDLIPSELNSHNKRFVLKSLSEKARFYQYETSFTWLKNSGIGLFVHNVDNPVYPLLSSKERTLFKLFLCDVGLLSYKLYQGNQIVLLNENGGLNYGAVYEAVVAQELQAHHFNLFYNSDKKRGEIDFLIEQGDRVIPIEVKSGKDYKRHNALSALLSNEDFGFEKGYVLCSENVERKGKTIYLPIYMIAFFDNKMKDAAQPIELDLSRLI